ncbi:MAG: VOC family protein, partial [Pseudomonadota bacterium]
MPLHSATPVLRTDDYQRSKAFYVDVLGFRCVEEAGEPVAGFGIFIRDKARVFIEAWIGAEPRHDRWRAYFHVTDLDPLAAEFRAKGGAPSDIVRTEYDMREVTITDPDG